MRYIVALLFICVSGLVEPPGPLMAQDAAIELQRSVQGESIPLPRSFSFVHTSDLLDEPYLISVSLPRTYSHTQRRYPVLYVLDADNTFSYVSGIYEMLRWDGLVPEMIIVGVGYGLDPIAPERLVRRTMDLTPVEVDGFPDATGGASVFSDFLRLELVPYIDGLMRTDPDARLLAGYSFGGLFAHYVLFHTPTAFQIYLLQSPSLWFGDGYAADYEEEYVAGHGDLPAKVFTSLGTLEPDGMHAPWARFVGAMEKRSYPGLTFFAMSLPGGRHDSVQPTALIEGLTWAFAGKSVDPSLLGQYTGVYDLDAGFSVTIEAQDGSIRLLHGESAIPLVAENERRFTTMMSVPIWRALADPDFPEEKRYLLGLEAIEFELAPDSPSAMRITADGRILRGTKRQELLR